MPSDRQRVLLVEDDKALRTALTATLRAAGYFPEEAATLASARQHVESSRPDLIILDLGLPDGDGAILIQELRAAGMLTPIVVLTARDDEDAKVRALDLGADDYVTKPFGIAELLARVRSALRHGVQMRGAPPIVRTADIEIDLAARTVRKGDDTVKLSRKEFDLLAELAASLGNPVSHQDLMEAVWGAPDSDIRYLRVYIGQLREKIEADPEHPALVLSAPGFGYRLAKV